MRKKYTAVYWRSGLMLEEDDRFEIYTTEEWRKNKLLITAKYALNYQLFPLTITELSIKEKKELDKIKKAWKSLEDL